MPKKIETCTSHIWLEDGIIFVVNLSQSEHTQEDARENLEASMRLAGGKKRPLLVDGTGARVMSREARKLYSSEEAAKLVLAQALILKSPISRVIGNFFLGLNQTPFPTRLFNNEEEALQWLRGFLA